MKNFISGKVETDFNKTSGKIRLNNIDLRMGEYICYCPADSRMLVIEPKKLFFKAMGELEKAMKNAKVNLEKAKDNISKDALNKEYSKLEDKYRSQMTSSFIFIYRGSDDTFDMEVPRNSITALGLENNDNNVTAILYDDESLFIINPKDEWMYDEDGDAYNKRPFINILKNAM